MAMKPGQESGREKVTLSAPLLPQGPGPRALLWAEKGEWGLLSPAGAGAGPAAGWAEGQLGLGWTL